MANLCNQYMNGLLQNPAEYQKAAEELLLIAKGLTEQELVLTNGKIGPEVKPNLPQTAVSTSVTGTGGTATAGATPAAPSPSANGTTAGTVPSPSAPPPPVTATTPPSAATASPV